MSDLKNNSLKKKDAQYLLHPASSISALVENGPQMIVSAKGCYITDDEGHELLDAVAGLWCVNVGYGRSELAQVMKDATEKLAYYHSFGNASNPDQVRLAEKLVKLAPQGLDKVFFGSGGSDANDTLIKIAWHYHTLKGHESKIKVIARQQAYHGTSISTASLTGLGGFHKAFPLPLDFVLRVGCPHFYIQGKDGESEVEFCDRLIQEVADVIEENGAENIAAFFAEPIHAAGGVIEPPVGYYPKLQTLLKQHDILLVADEVVCAYGRLGAWFGSDLLDIKPDMMATAKGLTSGYFPMSAAFMSNDIWQVLKQGSEQLGAFSHGYTYSGHPVGAAVALANIELLEKENLIEQAKKNGAYLHQQLHAALDDNPHVGEIRGRGMLAGIQLVKDKAKKILPEPSEKWPLKVSTLMRKHGVIVRPLPSVATLAISPPLTMNREQIDTLVKVLSDAIDEVL